MKKQVLLYIMLIIVFAFFVVGCGKKEEIKEPTKEEIKLQEIQKLKNALLEAGYVNEEEAIFINKIKDDFYADGTPKVMNYIYFDIDLLTYQQLTNIRALNVSSDKKYDIRNNIATGSTNFFKEGSSQINDIWKYNYDFNSGNSNCSSVLYTTCNDDSLISFKTELMAFLSRNDIDIEKIK